MTEAEKGDRIAKFLARAGVASRRDAEKMLAEGRVQHPYSRQLLTASKGFDREAIAAFADF